MKTFTALSATISASLLLLMVSAMPNLAIAVQGCARSFGGDHTPDCAHPKDHKNGTDHSRHLEFLTIQELNKSIRMTPNDASLYLRKAFILSELGHVVEALRNYDLAIRLNSNNPEAYFYRGNLYFKLGIANRALQDYARAISLNPKLPEVYVARAFVRAELGDERGAIADSDRARLLNLRDNGPQPPLIP
jgi:Flp pilus assembly protein TadD